MTPAYRSPDRHRVGGGDVFRAVPDTLKAYSQWMCWRRGKTKADGRFEKPPVNPHTGHLGSTNSPEHRGTFEQAVAAVERHGLGGISFVPVEEDPFTLVDIDNCRDPKTGDILKPWVRDWVERAGTYAEASPSGTGVRVVALGSVPDKVNKDGVEMYPYGQQLTITGDHLPGTPAEVRDAQRALKELYREYKGRQGGVEDLKIDESEPPVVLDDYGLSVWRGEKPARKEDGSGEVSRSLTLFKIGCVLAKAGATARVIRSAVAERDVTFGWRKYADRVDRQAERDYARIATRAVERAKEEDGLSSSSSPLDDCCVVWE